MPPNPNVYAVAKSCDRGETTRKDAAGAILYSAELSPQNGTGCNQPLGGNGYVNEYATGRLLRDAKLYEIGAGTSRNSPHAGLAANCSMNRNNARSIISHSEWVACTVIYSLRHPFEQVDTEVSAL